MSTTQGRLRERRTPLSRRQLVRSVAMAAVAAGIGGVTLTPEPARAEGCSLGATTTCSVLVVGAGAAGMAAAWRAAGTGVVMALEAGDDQSRSSSHAMGSATMYGAGTSVQADAGVVDSTDDLLADLTDRLGADADPDLLAACAEKFGTTIDRLRRLAGVPFKAELATDPADHVARVHAIDASQGDALTTLTGKAVEKGVAVQYGVTATRLVRDGDGKVTGVVARDASGVEHMVTAYATVIATGGFARDADMMAARCPDMAGNDVEAGVGMGADGSGIRLALDAGAAWRDGGAWLSPADGKAVRATLGGLRVNADMQVLDEAGEPIPGLYAAGEDCVGSLAPTRLPAEGSCLSWALASGTIAGAAASLFAANELVASGNAS